MTRCLVLVTLVALIVAACQGSGAVQPAVSPNGVASQAPSATTEPTATPQVTTNPTDIPVGLIVFHRRGSDGVERYFTIRTDGTDEHALYTAEGCECAKWSADGSKVLSVGATGHGTWSLQTILPDGTNKTVIEPPEQTLNLFLGASRPDGRAIALQGMDETDPSRSGLYVVSPDLSDVRLVTPLLEGWLAVEPFGVTPDGSRIVFFVETGTEGDFSHAGDLYVINDDGSDLRQLKSARDEKPVPQFPGHQPLTGRPPGGLRGRQRRLDRRPRRRRGPTGHAPGGIRMGGWMVPDRGMDHLYPVPWADLCGRTRPA
jgi:hypothetical protein